MKQRNIVKWYKAFVAPNDKMAQDVIDALPYTFVVINPQLSYSGRRGRDERVRDVIAWLRANVNRDRYVLCSHVNRNDVMTAQYDNAMWQFGKIYGVAFQHEEDAVLFKLANIQHIT
jgi:hypothetical protein